MDPFQLKIGCDVPGPKSLEGSVFHGGLDINQGGSPGSDTERLVAIRKLADAIGDLARALGPSPVSVSHCTFHYADPNAKPVAAKKRGRK